MRRSARWAGLILTLAAFVGGAVPVSASHVTGGGQSFAFLQPGFTQDLFGVSPHFMGGVAFAPDGDPWVDDCTFGGSELHRFDAQSSGLVVNTTPLHTESTHPSNAGCGLTNHSGGDMYTNTSAGVVRLNATTGVQNGGPFGPAGNALGIAEDPETGNLVYVGSDSTLLLVNSALTTSGTFSTVTTGNFLDGIAFDPSGDFLFVANRSPGFRLTILNGDTGALIQHVAMTSEPDGISFHATTPKFVITVNTDGTITRFDFPGDNYALPPVQSVFASGGFRGDLSQVGADGCVYLTQAGTRYNDLTVDGNNSLVRICGGFAPTPGVSSITLTPANATNPAGTSHTVTAHVSSGGVPLAGQVVSFVVTGQNAGATGTCVPAGCVTDSNGDVTFTYTGSNGAGDDTITASFTDSTGRLQSATAQKHWMGAGPPASLALSPTAATNVVDSQHCVTATVTDASSNPTPGITVRFSVTGSVTTSGTGTSPTDANGQATFCYTGPALPGADVISAYADTDNDNVNDPSPADPENTANKAWVLPPSTAGCKVTNGGWIIAANGDRANFGGNAKGSGPSGNENFQDKGPAADLHVKSVNVMAVRCSADGTSASIFGKATINGAGSYDYRIDVRDLAEPGSTDTYRIRLSNGYDSGDKVLSGGNIQIH